jgi:hypothetical protein
LRGHGQPDERIFNAIGQFQDFLEMKDFDAVNFRQQRAQALGQLAALVIGKIRQNYLRSRRLATGRDESLFGKPFRGFFLFSQP